MKKKTMPMLSSLISGNKAEETPKLNLKCRPKIIEGGGAREEWITVDQDGNHVSITEFSIQADVESWTRLVIEYRDPDDPQIIHRIEQEMPCFDITIFLEKPL